AAVVAGDFVILQINVTAALRAAPAFGEAARGLRRVAMIAADVARGLALEESREFFQRVAQLQPGAALLRVALFDRRGELAQINVPTAFAAKGGLRVSRLQLLRVAMGARYGDVSRALRHRTSK